VRGRTAFASALLVLPIAACASPPVGEGAQQPSRSPSSPTTTATTEGGANLEPTEDSKGSTAEKPDTEPGTVPPPWLGTPFLQVTKTGYAAPRPTPKALRHRRFTLPDTVAALPGRGFAARIVTPPPDRAIGRSSWAPRCPVAREQLAWLRLTFWGFDDRRHTGELLVDATVADDVVGVFEALYRARFPMEQVVVVGPYEPGGPTTGDGNGTGAFVCRPVAGGSSYSEHAYGLAVDVNTFQNPYLRDGVVLPELASAYLNRAWTRAGMITPAGPVVRAFAAIGWDWGGDWRTLKDYQHFSLTGR